MFFKSTLLVIALLPLLQAASEATFTWTSCPGNPSLPIGRDSLTAVYDGQDSIYVIGGVAPRSPAVKTHFSQVLRYDILTGKLENYTVLPDGVAYGGGAVAVSGYIYYVGTTATYWGNGYALYKIPSGTKRAIRVRYLEPEFRRATFSYDGQDSLYIFGGGLPGPDRQTIYRLDLVTQTLEKIKVTLKADVADAAVSWYNGVAYILGGETQHVTSDAVSTFENPRTWGKVPKTSNVIARLGEPTCSSNAVTIGSSIFLIQAGQPDFGNVGEGYFDTITEFNPKDKSTSLHVVEESEEAAGHAPIPSLSFATVYVPKQDMIYNFGGFGFTDYKASMGYKVQDAITCIKHKPAE